MTPLRRLLLDHRALAAALLALALLMRLLVPAGFMPVVADGVVAIELCGGTAPAHATAAMPGMAHHRDASGHQGRDIPCAFAGLAAPSLPAVDPLLLAGAIALVVAVVFAIPASVLALAPTFLRPPLRGPPARA